MQAIQKHAGGDIDLTLVEVSVSRRLCQCLGGRRAWWRRGEEGERVWFEAVSQLSRVSSNGAAGERMGWMDGCDEAEAHSTKWSGSEAGASRAGNWEGSSHSLLGCEEVPPCM